jgi:autotransporter-associated beta strand protein
VLTLTGMNTYTGPTFIEGGAINLAGSLQSDQVTVAPGATLGSTGTVFGTVINYGTVAPGFQLPDGVFGTLTVNNYEGAGGTLALRTFLGTDGSPSDVLAIAGINGSATGTSIISITNVGGPGAETTWQWHFGGPNPQRQHHRAWGLQPRWSGGTRRRVRLRSVPWGHQRQRSQ